MSTVKFASKSDKMHLVDYSAPHTPARLGRERRDEDEMGRKQAKDKRRVSID